jgi:hypothetical protein
MTKNVQITLISLIVNGSEEQELPADYQQETFDSIWKIAPTNSEALSVEAFLAKMPLWLKLGDFVNL